MAAFTATAITWVRAAFLAVALLELIEPSVALARVGVTSATSGDPLGRPPNEAERVLRIGIDVQANELVTTKTNDRAHLLFLDGTSLTVGPNSQITIDKYVFDPASKTGELAVTATTGVFRLVGGKISKKTPIVVNTPSSTIGVRGGISIFTVTDRQTVANFIFGVEMTVRGSCGSALLRSTCNDRQTVTRPGTQVTTNAGTGPSLPVKVPTGGLAGAITSLEGGSTSGSSASGAGGGTTSAGNPSGGTGGSATTGAATSGGTTQTGAGSNYAAAVDANVNSLAATNSNLNPATVPTTTTTFSTSSTGGSASPTNLTNAVTNIATNAVSNSTTQATVQTLAVDQQTAATSAPPQTTQTINGYTGGVVLTTTPDSGTSTRLLNAPGQVAPSDVSISTDASTSRAQATIIIRQYHPSSGRGLPPAVFQLGGPGASTFIDDTNVLMSDSTDPARKSQISGGTPSTFLASAKAANLQLPGNVTACVCEFLNWGIWASNVTFPNTPGAIRQGQVDTVFASYVAGTLTNLVQLPNTGMATYSGHAAGFVANGNATYFAAGTFNQTWNFASQTGSVTINNFDGATYSGNTALQSGTVNFTGPLSGAGRTGQINGSFFSSSSNPVAGQAGSFSVTGTGYKAGGIFAGQR
jgi:hypothetical protein